MTCGSRQHHACLQRARRSKSTFQLHRTSSRPRPCCAHAVDRRSTSRDARDSLPTISGSPSAFATDCVIHSRGATGLPGSGRRREPVAARRPWRWISPRFSTSELLRARRLLPARMRALRAAVRRSLGARQAARVPRRLGRRWPLPPPASSAAGGGAAAAASSSGDAPLRGLAIGAARPVRQEAVVRSERRQRAAIS